MAVYDLRIMTDVVTLRPLEPVDAPVIAGWAADPEFVRVADWAIRPTIREYEKHHLRIIESPPPGLIRLGADLSGQLIGYVDFFGADLGYLIGGRERWGRGLGLQAASLAVRHGFTALRLPELTAGAADTNHRSIRILTGLGFQETGRVGEHRRFRLSAS